MPPLTRRRAGRGLLTLAMAAALAPAAPSASLLVGRAWAQPAPPTRLRGTIVALEGDVLTVATREGSRVAVRLAEPLAVSALRRVPLSGIAPGAFVGVAAEPGPDGGWRALEVHVFPESARGTGEGHRAWDLVPGSSMTNATVTATVAGTSGRELTMAYRGGTVTVTVPPDAPVVTPIPAGRADLVPGARVFLMATPDAEGRPSTGRITVGKDGVDPPM
ncbi:hypothetical protein M0638_06730 [Roseomonas sp. NAR14]|uniref:DUF5666 domain-containing protein n=1 Tax=Roseomonas acroporae TaxID=2937791 RepID=A0A9X1Y6J2_9PROT|nr:hypothetical protein [Roseomonas acroporae]MCK8784072.1 hypothetical protein [Roseomonas acroporae]